MSIVYATPTRETVSQDRPPMTMECRRPERPKVRQWLRILRRFSLGCTLAIALLGATNSPSVAEKRALLVGVSAYHNSRITRLQGPVNDVTLMWRTLTRRQGFKPEFVTVLADGMPKSPDFPDSSADPSREAITQALKKLAAEAASGDSVVVYFSGHGTQQPVRNTQQLPELNNMDQVMLPIDAGIFNTKTGTIENGIVDDEIASMLDAIRRKGANVWAIIDACHAGTMTRGPVEGTTVRGVAPATLDVPAPSRKSTAANSDAPTWRLGRESVEGRLAGFFAVDSAHEAIERAIDEFDPPLHAVNGRRVVGIFTYFLFRALENTSQSAVTFRQLARQIVHAMDTSALAPPAMPSFDGDLDDALPSRADGQPETWAVTTKPDELEIAAGSLHGLSENTILNLFETPSATGPAWGQATITSSEALRSRAAFEPARTDKPPSLLWAAIAAPGVSFKLTVALPPDDELAIANASAVIDDVKERLKRSKIDLVEWVPTQAVNASIRLRIHGNRVWLLPPDGEWVRPDLKPQTDAASFADTPSLALAASNASSDLFKAIYSRLRAANIVRVAELSEQSRRKSVKPARVRVELELWKRRLATPANAPCDDRDRNSSELFSRKPVDDGLPRSVSHCDLINVRIANTSEKPIDVNVAYVEAGGSVGAIGGCSMIVPPGGEIRRIPIWIVTWDKRPLPLGREYVIVTAAEQENGISNDLCFIQHSVPTRGPNDPVLRRPLLRLLNDASLVAAPSRGKFGLEDNPQTDQTESWMFIYPLSIGLR
jgi:hypothetical protein